MQSLLKLLARLAELGPRVGPAMAIIEHMIEDARQLVELFSDVDGFSARMPVTVGCSNEEMAELARLENEVAVAIEGRAGPVTDRLKSVFAFLRDNPELVQLLLLLIKA